MFPLFSFISHALFLSFYHPNAAALCQVGTAEWGFVMHEERESGKQ